MRLSTVFIQQSPPCGDVPPGGLVSLFPFFHLEFGEVAVKGRHQPVKVYELVALA